MSALPTLVQSETIIILDQICKPASSKGMFLLETELKFTEFRSTFHQENQLQSISRDQVGADYINFVECLIFDVHDVHVNFVISQCNEDFVGRLLIFHLDSTELI